LAQCVVDQLILRGLAQATAGEFTARAYLNGRLDLSAAEGVQACIAASHEGELRAARQLMAGELSRRLAPLMEQVTATLALVEAGIDFSEEDISFITNAELVSRVDLIRLELQSLMHAAPVLQAAAHCPTFVLVGAPNAGKSTLLNALAGYDRAVVSAVSGTTRDALSANVVLPRGLIEVIDVAGLDDASSDIAEHAAERLIAQQMQARALRAIESADFVVHVIDGNRPIHVAWPREPDLVVVTKSDTKSDVGNASHVHGDVYVSALTGDGISTLRDALDRIAFTRADTTAALALTARQTEALGRATDALRCATEGNNRGAEMTAFDLRAALNALGDVLGHVTPDDVLGRVFASFCIGK